MSSPSTSPLIKRSNRAPYRSTLCRSTTWLLCLCLTGFAYGDVLVLLDGTTQRGQILDCDSTHLTFHSYSSDEDAAGHSIPLSALDPYFHHAIRARFLSKTVHPRDRYPLIELCESRGLTRLALFEWDRTWEQTRPQEHSRLRTTLLSMRPRLESSHANTLYQEGLVRRSLGRWEEAKEFHQTVLSAFPDSPSAPKASFQWADMLAKKRSKTQERTRKLLPLLERRTKHWKKALVWANAPLREAHDRIDEAMSIPIGGGRSPHLLLAWNLLTQRSVPRIQKLIKRMHRDQQLGQLPSAIPNLLQTAENRIRIERLGVALELGRIHLLQGRSGECNRWAIRALLLDPGNTEAMDLRANRILHGLSRDPFRMPKGSLIRQAARRSHLDGPTLRAMDRRLSNEEIDSIKASRQTAGLDPIPGS